MTTDPSATSATVNPYEPPPVMADEAPTGSAEIAPPLMSDVSFWGMTATQFLGAFNDNLFKQLVLLLAVSGAAGGAAAAADANGQGQDTQSLAMAVFAVPFLLFSGFAGLVSERNSKRTVIVACKFAEVVIVLLGMAAFALWHTTGMVGVLSVLFLMGTHSAFFGPAKYGVLPELFDKRNLPIANGIILMTLFLAIIFGTALAGWLKDLLGNDRLYLASGVCLVLAALGTQSALMVRRVAPADPSLKFDWMDLAVPVDVARYLSRDRSVLYAILASSMFWLIGGLVQPSVNSLGKVQFQVSDTKTSILAASMGIGIALGCVLAGMLSRSKVNFRLMRIGSWIIVATLAALALPGQGNWNLLGYYGTLVDLVLLGVGAGFFAVPLQVFLQSRPPESLKGRTIATTNLANWIAIFIAAGAYYVFDMVIFKLAWARASSFALTSALMLPVAIFYRPRNEELK